MAARLGGGVDMIFIDADKGGYEKRDRSKAVGEATADAARAESVEQVVIEALVVAGRLLEAPGRAHLLDHQQNRSVVRLAYLPCCPWPWLPVPATHTH